MGCPKLAFSLEKSTALRCVWNSCEQSKTRVRWYDYGARMYDPAIGRWFVIDPMIEQHYDYTPYAYVYNNPLIFIDPFGLDSVYILDQAEVPEETDSYTADMFVICDGTVYGPYEGSSFPDDEEANTLNEGEYEYNNEYGHSSGSRQGLNVVDEDGNRNASGTDPDGNEVTMTNVNVHDSYNENSRYSEGCPTVPHADPEGFFENFDWNGSYNGYTGNTGNSTGSIILQRGENADGTRTMLQDRLDYQQHPLRRIEPRQATLAQ